MECEIGWLSLELLQQESHGKFFQEITYKFTRHFKGFRYYKGFFRIHFCNRLVSKKSFYMPWSSETWVFGQCKIKFLCQFTSSAEKILQRIFGHSGQNFVKSAETAKWVQRTLYFKASTNELKFFRRLAKN